MMFDPLHVALRISTRLLTLVLVLHLQTTINLQNAFVEAFSASPSLIAPITKYSVGRHPLTTATCQGKYQQQAFGIPRPLLAVESVVLGATSASEDFASNDVFTIQILMSDTGGGYDFRGMVTVSFHSTFCATAHAVSLFCFE